MFSFKIFLYFNLFWSIRYEIINGKKGLGFCLGLFFELGIKEIEKRINFWFVFYRFLVVYFIFNVN